jgi:phage baseplate assembly protein V
MERMTNLQRREAQRVLSQVGLVRMAVVTSYDPSNYAAKVRIQPEDTETGFLPITTPWVGNGWGMFSPPTAGDVVDVHFQEGGKQAGFIALRHFGDQFRPLKVPSGEFWLVDKLGNSFKFSGGKVLVNGTTEIDVTAPTLNIVCSAAVNVTTPTMTLNGNLMVNGTVTATGDILDRSASGGYTMASFRATYDTHTHGGVQGGSGHTDVPDEVL